MGTSRSSEEFVRKTLAAAARLGRYGQPTLRAAGTTAVRIEKQAMARAVGGDLRMGRMQLGVRYDGPFGNDSIIIKATGPAHLIERDTDAHWIGPKRKRGGRTRKGNASFLGGMQMLAAFTGGGGGIAGGLGRGRSGISGQPTETGWSAYAKHPGTTGKHPFAKGQQAAREPVAKVLRHNTTRELMAAYG